MQIINSGHHVVDARSSLSLSSGGGFGKNVIFEVNNSNSSWVHVDNRKKDIFILGEGPTDVLDDLTITARAEYSID